MYKDKEKMKAYYRECYALRKKEGICTRCGKEKIQKNLTTCLPCTEKRQIRTLDNMRYVYSERVKNGLCTKCGEMARDNKTLCQKCVSKQTVKIELLRKERNNKNLCGKCGQAERWFGRVNCIICSAKNAQKTSAYDAPLEVRLMLYARQDGACLICKTYTDDIMNLYVDHDHKTNKVRGLLCGNCNTGLGYFFDNPTLLIEAKNYIIERKNMGIAYA